MDTDIIDSIEEIKELYQMGHEQELKRKEFNKHRDYLRPLRERYEKGEI